MPKASRESASQTNEAEGYEGHYEDFGEYTVGFESFSADTDFAPVFAALPDGRCQSPHWGIVLKGTLTYTYADGQDVIQAGEAYYAPPGHIPSVVAGTEVIEFSPSAELAKTLEAISQVP
jgi:hypothetical protein